MDLAVVVPHLAFMGGAIRLVIECLKYWVRNNEITLYTCTYDPTLLEEAGLTKIRIESMLSYRQVEEYIKDPQYAIFFDHIVFPRYWNLQVGRHEIYNFHFFPANLVKRRPAVWYPHEPFRIAHDLRYEFKHPWVPNIYTKTSTIPRSHDHVNLTQSHRDILANSVIEVLPNYEMDAVVANSRFSAEMLERAYGIKVTDVVYPGTHIPAEVKEPSENNTILTVANLEWHKRVDLLLQAMRFVKDGHLVVIGYSNEEHDKQFEYMLDVWDVRGKVTFVRLASEETLRKYLEESLCLAFVPLREPFGIALLEAMAAGKPVIAVKEGGFIEILTEEAALFVPASPFRIAEAINRLIKDRDLARRLGRKGREVAKAYTWERTATELEGILRRTLERHKRKNTRPGGIGKRPVVGALYRMDYVSRRPEEYAGKGSEVNMPLLGYYDSSRGYVIEQHLQWAREMGIDFFLVNVPCEDMLEDTSFYPPLYLNVVRLGDIIETNGHPIKFALRVRMGPHCREKKSFLVRLLYQSFMLRESYLRLDGVPVCWFETPDAEDCHTASGELGAEGIEPRILWWTNAKGRGIGMTVQRDRRILIVDPGARAGDERRSVQEQEVAKILDRLRKLKAISDIIIINSFNDFDSRFYLEPDVICEVMYKSMLTSALR